VERVGDKLVVHNYGHGGKAGGCCRMGVEQYRRVEKAMAVGERECGRDWDAARWD